MLNKMYKKIRNHIDNWLIEEPKHYTVLPYDFNRLKYEIKPGDVLLIEGHSRVSNVIRTLTQSPWTHAALYVGRIIDFEDEQMQDMIRNHTHADAKDNTRLIVEGLLDQGTIITPLSFYRNHHIRICRPIGITPSDTHLVINYAIKALGQPYNVRDLLELLRLLLPWTILPRRWGSSLFRTPTGQPDSTVCSSLIAEAFSSVQFPILPFIKPDEQTGVELFERNPHLFTPKDFDYSPYFDIIKYPLFNPDEPLPYYRRLPWTKTGFLHQDQGAPTPKIKKSLNPFKRHKTKNTNNESGESSDDSSTHKDVP